MAKKPNVTPLGKDGFKISTAGNLAPESEWIANYFREFKISLGVQMPERARMFFLNKEFERINGKNIALLPNKAGDVNIELHFHGAQKTFSRLMVLANHVSAYFGDDIGHESFVPLCLLDGELACLGLVTGDKDSVYFFGQEIQQFKYKDGVSRLKISLDELVGAEKPIRNSKSISRRTVEKRKPLTLTQEAIEDYYHEIRKLTDKKIPVRVLQFFEKREYESLDGKNVTKYLEGYSFGSRANLEIELEKMKTLAVISNDGYFGKSIYFPLATIKGQSAFIGVKATDKNSEIYFFDSQDGFFPQGYTVDELISKIK